MDSHCDVSLVVPCYNAAETVSDTIASISAQTHARWELVCVDDQSTDPTPEIIANAARADQRIRGLKIPHGGVSVAMNRGLAETHAAHVLFLGADDLLRPDALAVLLAAARAAGESALVTSGCEWLDERGCPLGFYQFSPPGQFNLESLLWSNTIVGTTLIPRIALKTRPFDESLTCCEDWDLWLQLAHAGVACRSVPRVTYGYRLVRRSLSHSADRLFTTARRVQARWLPFAGASAQLAGIEHHLAWVCGALAAASGAPQAVHRYLAGLPELPVTPEFERRVADCICWAFQFALGAQGQTWRRQRAEWLAAADVWLAQTPLARCRGAILAHLAAISLAPTDRLEKLEAWLATVRSAQRLVIYGLGCNGITLLERLRDHPAAPAELAIADDFAQPEVFSALSLPRDDPRQWPTWPAGTLVVVTPNESAGMQATLTRAGGRPGADFLVLATSTASPGSPIA
jgi:GT2 family glycosyltransferase